MVQSCRDQDKAGTFVVLDQLQEISNTELVTNQGKDIIGGIQPRLCISFHLQITMNQWNTRRWMKTPMLMCLRRLNKITQDHLSMRHR